MICYEKNGEPSRARTCDPLIKSQLLYQLSYRPTTEEKLYVGKLTCQASAAANESNYFATKNVSVRRLTV